ncbi:Serine carboxypeptidase-like 2 [Camellia lanceoleosa]|uniref:Serine carboxypeptidase-like 2 n=1 Tax=Camellia lanceoleosa TaxID=1840588 RepID=A0ACC0IGY9_9ERIC|nr:Serine carboxypeptidase-like 2 [Camellia lanceoleosa]
MHQFFQRKVDECQLDCKCLLSTQIFVNYYSAFEFDWKSGTLKGKWIMKTSTRDVALSHSIVKTLPGYKGDLPFKLETGYVNVSVGKSDAVNLFYYFIESEGNPREDPLMLWLTGGPGCSGFSGLVYEIGPLNFDTENFDGDFPTFVLNPYSWTKVANIIFLDAPVGTGFSYASNWESYVLDDQLSATETYNFLMIWLMDHPQFLSNDLYISGDSYSGLIVPIIVQKIYVGNLEVGVEPLIKLKGYVLGNPLTHEHDDPNSRVEFAHRLALISDGLYESTKTNCHGEYLDVDPSNAPCIKDLQLVTKGSIEKWVRCNKTLSYNEDLLTSIEYHRNLSHTDLRALIYSGDHDMAIPYVGTHKWINSLALPVGDDWRPWFVDGQVGGLVLRYLLNSF